MAQIASEIWRVAVTNPKSINTKDFLIRFITVEKQAEMRKSKEAWGQSLGLDVNRN